MKVYHLTRARHAGEIQADGFRDHVDTYLTDSLHKGVWVSDRPLVVEAGFADAVCFEIEVPEESLVEHEWIEAGKSYREFLLPAATLNALPRRKLSDEELTSLS